MKAKIRSLGGFSLLARGDLGEGGAEGLAEPLSLLPGVRLDVALGDVNPHRHFPPPLWGFHLVQDSDGGQAGGALNTFLFHQKNLHFRRMPLFHRQEKA
jgi:hypothetical protein